MSMKLDAIKKIPTFFKQLLKPDWKRIAFLIILFMVLPESISGNYILFGGVYFVKSLFDFYQPVIDLYFTIIILIASYAAVSVAIWIYERKVNTLIINEGEEDVQPEEEPKQEAQEAKPENSTPAEGEKA